MELFKGFKLIEETFYPDGSAYKAVVKYYGNEYLVTFYNNEWHSRGINGSRLAYTPQWQRASRDKAIEKFLELKRAEFPAEWVQKHNILYEVA